MKLNEVRADKPVIVNFQGEINQFATNELAVTLDHLANIYATQVKLAITTPGGEVSKGMFLYNLIRALPFDVITHNTGTVDSIGNVIYLAGKKRFATPNSRFMLHGVARTFKADGDGEVSLNERALRDALKYVEGDQEIIAQTIALNTTLTHDAIRDAFRDGDTIMTPEEAKANGLVHEIVDFKIGKGTQVLSVWSR